MAGVDAHEIRQSPLWGHMTQLLSQVIRERPRDALAAMEAISNQILTGSAVPPMKGTMYADPRPTARTSAPADSFSNARWAANTNTALAPPRPPRRPRRADGEEDEEEPANGEDGAAAVDLADHPGTLSDVVTEQQYFNMVGLGLPPADAYRVLVGLRQLIRAEPLSSVRFWGVVLGSQASDYYVAECQVDAERAQESGGLDGEEEGEEDMEEEQEHAPVSQIADILCTSAAHRRPRRGPRPSTPVEEAGTGLNSMCYYVAASADPMTWTKLPDVAPHHVTVARQLRCRFTGDLSAPVHGHPRFLGCEKHYLRAQIARITHACRIAPTQMYTTESAIPEEEEEEDETGKPMPARPPRTQVPAYAAVPPLLPQEQPDEEDEAAVAAVQAWHRGYAKGELLSGKGWSHIAPTVLRNGRATTVPPAEEDEEDYGEEANEDGEVAGAAAVTAPSPPPPAPELIAPFLSAVELDASLTYPGHSRTQLPAWTFRKAYQNEGGAVAVYVAKSLRWPGAATYAVTSVGRPGAVYQMLYCGTGLKDMEESFYSPPLPPPCCLEYIEAPGEFDGERDCTVDEEIRYAPPPPRPAVEGGEDEEADEEEDD